MDLKNEDSSVQNYNGEIAQQLRKEQYERTKPFFDHMKQAELEQIRRQLVTATKTAHPKLNIVSEENIDSVAKLEQKLKEIESTQPSKSDELDQAIAEAESILNTTQPTVEEISSEAVQELQSTLNEIESWEQSNEPKKQAADDLSTKIISLGRHRKTDLETPKTQISGTDQKTQQLYMMRLEQLKKFLLETKWGEKTVNYNKSANKIVEKNEPISDKKQIVKIPAVIASMLVKIASAKQSNAGEIMNDIRRIADSASKEDASNLPNRWTKSQDTRNKCKNITKAIDSFLTQQPQKTIEPPSPQRR